MLQEYLRMLREVKWLFRHLKCSKAHWIQTERFAQYKMKFNPFYTSEKNDTSKSLRCSCLRHHAIMPERMHACTQTAKELTPIEGPATRESLHEAQMPRTKIDRSTGVLALQTYKSSGSGSLCRPHIKENERYQRISPGTAHTRTIRFDFRTPPKDLREERFLGRKFGSGHEVKKSEDKKKSTVNRTWAYHRASKEEHLTRANPHLFKDQK